MPSLLIRSGVDLGLAGELRRVAAVAFGVGQILDVVESIGAGLESAEDATDEGVCAQAVGAVVLVLALAGGEDAGDVGHLIEVDPHAAHGVVHAGEDLHGDVAGIVADEFFVDFKDAFELAVEGFAVDVGEVEIDHGLAVDAEAFFIDDFVDGAGGDVAGDEVAVFWEPLFEEVEALGLGDFFDGARVAGGARNPDAAAFAAG